MTRIPRYLKIYTDPTDTTGHLRSSDPSSIFQQGDISNIAARTWRRGAVAMEKISAFREG
jgi:hypothetical protein